MDKSIKCWYVDHAFDQSVGGPCCFQPIGNISTFNEMRQHSEYIEIKNSFERGEWPENYCTKCRDIEFSNPNLKISKRQTAEKFYSKITPEQDANKTLTSIILETGKYCNLQCRSCGPSHSSNWLKETQSVPYVRMKDMPTHWISAHDPIAIKKYTVWPSNEYDFSDDLSSVKYVNFIGGEPLYNTSFMREAMDRLYDQAGSQCHISIQTNASINYKSVMPLLSKFKNVELSLSLDAVGKPSEFIRTGSNWGTVSENIRYYVSQSNIKLNCHTTHSVLNLFELANLRNWLADMGIVDSEEKSFATWPSYLSCDILTDVQRDKVIKYLNDNNLKYVIQYVSNSKFDEVKKTQFLNFMEHTKQYHGMSWQEYLPELYELINTEI
jgi:MoaA/NifB/PqqE/SkfB family radical SAM enzyme